MNTQITTGPAVNSFSSCPNFEAKHFLNSSIPDVPLALTGKPACLLLSLHSQLLRLHCSLPSSPPIGHISVLPRTQTAIHINYYIRSIFLSKNFIVSSYLFSSFFLFCFFKTRTPPPPLSSSPPLRKTEAHRSHGRWQGL